MSAQPSTAKASPNATLAAGTVIVLAMIAAYLWGEARGVDTAPLLAIISPVVGAIFLVPRIETIRANTNGHLSSLTSETARLTEENAQLREQLAARPE